LSEAVARDRDRLRARLRATFARPEVREALFLASPELAGVFHFWLEEPASARGRGIERALVRYLARMAGRPTPFGLFAGLSVGKVAESTRLTVAGRDSYRRASRLDLGYLFALVDRLAREPAIRKRLTYFPNSSIYRVGRHLRYVEARLEGRRLVHELVAVEATEYVEATLAHAHGGRTPAKLAQPLAGDRISAEEAERYVEELIDNQVLVPELAIPVTGRGPLDVVAEDLLALAPAREVGDRLAATRARLTAVDAAGLGVDVDSYRAALEPLAGLDGEPSLQVDLFKPAPQATLGKRLLKELLRGVDLLHRLTPAADASERDRFREAFVERYGEREVRLLEALDPDTGVGFPPAREDLPDAAPLLAGLDFPLRTEMSVRWGLREQFLLRLAVEAAAKRQREVVLGGDELERLAGAEDSRPLPGAFAVIAALAARSAKALERGDVLLLIEGIALPSSALLGRFCHGDPELRRLLAEHLRAEEALEPDAVFAEIVHLPEGRLGNVICRPVLRRYEIPYLGRSGVPARRRIAVSDLLLSVRDGRLVLRSARLGRRVIPRLSTAHDFRQLGIPVYRFLASLQFEGHARPLPWDWGPLADAPSLPRVRVGRLVLSPARWNVWHDELRGRLGEGEGARFGALQAWLRARGLPRLASFAHGDERLPIDFGNVLSAETFLAELRLHQRLTLVELFPPDPGELCAEGPEGRFVHELIVPFAREPETRRPRRTPLRRAAAPADDVRRRFPPGAEWLSAALYVGPALADEVLLDTLAPLVSELIVSRAIDRWFFVRFADPEWHLRVRFHVPPAFRHSTVRPALEEAGRRLLDEERAWRFRLDTYEREIERYGGPEGVVLSEKIFHADSEAVLAILAHLDGGDGDRWRAAVAGIDALLTDAGLGPEAKERLLERLRDGFARDLRADSTLWAQVGRRFREERRSLEALLDTRDSSPPPWHDHLRRRSERLAPLFDDLRSLARAGRLSSPLPDLAASYVHMHANRLLRAGHRAHELVLYDFLARLYHSRRARSRRP
jgi:thiopeptide-type bacteriocin biosynthesis protein